MALGTRRASAGAGVAKQGRWHRACVDCAQTSVASGLVICCRLVVAAEPAAATAACDTLERNRNRTAAIVKIA